MASFVPENQSHRKVGRLDVTKTKGRGKKRKRPLVEARELGVNAIFIPLDENGDLVPPEDIYSELKEPDSVAVVVEDFNKRTVVVHEVISYRDFKLNGYWLEWR